MAEKKAATRDGYGKALAELGHIHEDIVVLVADLAETCRTAYFAKEFPERHFNFGIAEANMMAAAAGLATVGYTPFASSFAMFAAGRAFEQVRNSIGYPALNVKIGASHAGLSVGEDGASHQCCEDIALMRSIPGMTIINPCDEPEARAAVVAAYEHNGPVYIRTSRFATPVVSEGRKFELGKGVQLRDGKDITIVATGIMVAEALDAAAALAGVGIDARVVNIHTIKPLDGEIIAAAARETKGIITVEEHSVVGGLGEAVCSFVAENCPTRVRRIGVQDVFGCSGPAAEVLKYFGLSAENIANVAREMLGK